MKDIAIVLENKPGSLAELGEILGKENINIEGICGATCEGEDLIHILVEESGRTYNILERAGYEIKEQRDILIIEIALFAKAVAIAIIVSSDKIYLLFMRKIIIYLLNILKSYTY